MGEGKDEKNTSTSPASLSKTGDTSGAGPASQVPMTGSGRTPAKEEGAGEETLSVQYDAEEWDDEDGLEVSYKLPDTLKELRPGIFIAARPQCDDATSALTELSRSDMLVANQGEGMKVQARGTSTGGGGGSDGSNAVEGAVPVPTTESVGTKGMGEKSMRTDSSADSKAADEGTSSICDDFRRSRSLQVALAAVIVIIIAAIVVIAVLASNNSGSGTSDPNSGSGIPELKDSDPAPSSVPTPVPTHGAEALARFEEMKVLLEEIVGRDVLEDTSSPEYMALEWMALWDEFSFDWRNDYPVLVQRYALATFYFSTGGPDWQEQANFLSSEDVCDWNSGELLGVWCAGDDPNTNSLVERVWLPNNNLSGKLPPVFLYLKGLAVLDLSHNNLSGNLPERIGRAKLRDFDLSHNSLGGVIPPSLAELTSLRCRFNLQSNKLSGTIPGVLGLGAYRIDLSDNLLSGSIPEGYSTIQHEFEYLGIHGNNITDNLTTFCAGYIEDWLSYVTADCSGESPEVLCTCCQECWDDDGNVDMNVVWRYSEHEECL